MGILDDLKRRSEVAAPEKASEKYDLKPAPTLNGGATGSELDRAERARSKPSALKTARRDVSEMLDTLLGPNCVEAFQVAADIVKGKLKDPLQPERHMFITVKERLEAAMWIAEMRNGKAPSKLDVDVTRTDRVEFDFTNASDEDLAELERLYGRIELVGPGEALTKRKVETVEGEVIPPIKGETQK
jgi:hypothetical protein